MGGGIEVRRVEEGGGRGIKQKREKEAAIREKVK